MASYPSARAEMSQLLRSREKYFSLAQKFYADPEFYELDLDAIFHRQWIFAGAECEILNPGDYMTFTVGRTPILVLRDRAGEIRAFLNTCRHRGSKICVAPKGSVKTLVCPYHQWMYDLTGRLVSSTRMHDGFKHDGFSLKPVHVQRCAGTIYVCLAETPPDFAPYASTIAPYLAPHDLANAKLALEMDMPVKGNWKLVMENSRECYHCIVRHPELMHTFLAEYNFADPADDAAIAAFWQKCESLGFPSAERHGDNFRIVRLPFSEGAVSISMDGKPVVRKLLGAAPHNEIGSVRWVHYPTTFNHALADYAILIRMLPIGPQETLFSAKWLVSGDAEEGRDYDVETLGKVWAVTNEQDKVLVERNQEGVNSVGYVPGPYSQKTEGGVIQFVEWYCRTMEAHLEGQPQRIAAE